MRIIPSVECTILIKCTGIIEDIGINNYMETWKKLPYTKLNSPLGQIVTHSTV